jgi:ACR3 family arsenite efflux pump ArsB
LVQAQNVQNSGRENALYTWLSAVAVFLISFGVYAATVAPTVAFWDCGEYTAAGQTLGVPHPPGNPLFILLMRIASMFMPFFGDVGYRMNFAAALASALTAMVLFLAIVEAGKLFVGEPDTAWKRVCLCVGGLVGGLFAAFGYTFWFSAVETSVYNFSMLVVAVCTLLMLVWARSKRADRDKLLVLVAFLGFLGIGLHMYTMIIFPPAFLFMILWDEKKRYDWRLWITGILMAAVIYSLSAFMILGAITLLVTLIMSITSIEHRYEWRFCFFLALFAIIGYSVHLVIPIRAGLEPMINENHPSTWAAFVDFLERKQYGSESMITRMFWRRGHLANQFGIEEHIGFGGFHLTQFFRLSPVDTAQSFFKAGFVTGISKLIVYLIPTAFMLFGWNYLYRANKHVAVFLISLTLLTTVGMVLYMNFADGLRPERYDYEQWMHYRQQLKDAFRSVEEAGPMPTVHREVRVRDYFFTAGFMYFGMWLGLAAVCLLHALFTCKDEFMNRAVAPVCAAALALSPVIPAAANHNLSTRAGDWVPYDYAYNLLNSCEENGILFTNGDNDTFPLWALQEAYGVRKDVRIVNLSLVNTDWYIKQLKKLEPKVPISFSEKEITGIQPQRNPFDEPIPYTLENAGITVTLPGKDTQRALRVQDVMVLNIVDATAWSKPIYFAMTVSDDNLMGLAPYLQAQGLVFKLMRRPVNFGDNYDLDRTVALLDSAYSLRGIGKAKTNDTSRRLLTNYLQIAFDLRQPMDKLKREAESLKAEAAEAMDTAATQQPAQPASKKAAEAEKLYRERLASVVTFLDKCVEIMPWDWRARGIHHEFLMDHGMFGEAAAALERSIAEDPENRVRYEPLLEKANAAKGRG